MIFMVEQTPVGLWQLKVVVDKHTEVLCHFTAWSRASRICNAFRGVVTKDELTRKDKRLMQAIRPGDWEVPAFIDVCEKCKSVDRPRFSELCDECHATCHDGEPVAP